MGVTFFAILLRIISNSMSNVYQKQLTAKAIDPFLINFIMYFGLTICCIPIIIRTPFLTFPHQIWANAILGGMCGALGNSYLVKALKNGELSILGPINAYKSVVALVFGIILLHEIPSIIGLVGIILIICGSYFIFDTQEEGFSFKLLKRKDIRYRFYALIFTAIEAVFAKNVILYSDVKISFMFWSFFGMVFTGILLLPKLTNLTSLNQILTTKKFIFTRLLLIILCMGGMQICTNIVFSRMNVSYGLALFQLSTILSVFLGWHYFKEQQILKKLLGSSIMIVGAIIIILCK